MAPPQSRRRGRWLLLLLVVVVVVVPVLGLLRGCWYRRKVLALLAAKKQLQRGCYPASRPPPTKACFQEITARMLGVVLDVCSRRASPVVLAVTQRSGAFACTLRVLRTNGALRKIRRSVLAGTRATEVAAAIVLARAR